jgi:hypothetical protein
MRDKGKGNMNSIGMSHATRLTQSLRKIIFSLPVFLVCGGSLFPPVAQGQSADSPTFHINSQRLQGTLEKLSEFGQNLKVASLA